MKNDDGASLTLWDGTTYKRHPVTNKLMPDNAAQIATYQYVKPSEASWPDCEFVVGNPPFIGNKLLRRRLGDGYVDALFASYKSTPNNVDLVMYWWEKSAKLLSEGKIRGFGWVTTNSYQTGFE